MNLNENNCAINPEFSFDKYQSALSPASLPKGLGKCAMGIKLVVITAGIAGIQATWTSFNLAIQSLGSSFPCQGDGVFLA